MCLDNICKEAFDVTCSNNRLPVYEPVMSTRYIINTGKHRAGKWAATSSITGLCYLSKQLRSARVDPKKLFVRFF
ncbi:hypothetical protein Hanom_Chr04g00315101 [Helianthus anomalus]